MIMQQAAAGNDLVLEARDVVFGYADVPALAGASLAVPRHAKVALLGPNGSGKTTLFLHLNGTFWPQKGEVRVDSDPGDYSRAGLREWRRRVGLVFQNPDDQLFAATVAQDVSFGPANLGLPEGEVRARVEEALAILRIADLRDRPTHRLSFGQKRRVAIAGAMAMRPEVLLLDEPISGLDPAGASEMVEALGVLHAAGTTLVIATHDMDFAWAWAEQVAVMQAGRVAHQGDSAAILADPGVLSGCRLQMPTVLALALALRERGLLPAEAALPRTPQDLAAMLEGKALL